MLSFSVLASGSNGNALYIQSEQTKILVDAGVSGKQIQQRMEQVTGAKLADIEAVFITHEHVDHVRGLRQALKQSHAPLYITEGTWSQVKQADDAPPASFVKAGQAIVVGDIHVTPFAISHDAEEPVMYRFDSGGTSLTVLTDLGYVSDQIKSVIQGCQSYVFETNHDVAMLRAGRYPWSLKRRILGDKGHLSNEDAAVALADVLCNDTVDVYMAHLSEENNQVDLAQLTVSSVLQEIKAIYGEQVTLHRTSRHEPTPLHSLYAKV